MGKFLIVAAYCVYAAFWLRFFAHFLVWWRAAQRLREPTGPRSALKACVLTAVDVLLLGRVLNVNPALWIGEWAFHASFLFVILRHLRYFLDPVPLWVWWLQTPGLIAGYVLPFAAAYILVIRLLTRHEKYAAPANSVPRHLVLLISSLGVIMQRLVQARSRGCETVRPRHPALSSGRGAGEPAVPAALFPRPGPGPLSSDPHLHRPAGDDGGEEAGAGASPGDP